MSKWILVLLATLAISIPSLAQYNDKDRDKDKSSGNAEQQVKQIDDEYRQAVLKGDFNFIEKHMADNYVGIGGNGQEINKQQNLQDLKERKVKYDAIDLKDTKVRMFGNTAIVDHEGHVKGTGPNGPIDGDYRARLIWEKEGGTWKLIGFQSTPVRASQAATNK